MIDMSAKSTGEVVETAMVGRDSVMIKGDRPCIALALQFAWRILHVGCYQSLDDIAARHRGPRALRSRDRKPC
jgi:hypothetical protein